MPNFNGEHLTRIGKEAEILVASKLRDQGYCVLPSENRSYDLLCEHLRIEVKIAYPTGGQWIWAFNNHKNFSESCDVVVLVAKKLNTPGFHYFIFPSDHPFFYDHEGQPRSGRALRCTLFSKRCPRSVRKMFNLYRDRWDIINNILQAD